MLTPLIDTFREEDNATVCADIVKTLIGIGSKAVPGLTKALKDESSTVRYYAAYTLAEIKGDVSSAIPAITETLKDEDYEVRLTACMTLFKLTKKADKAMPVLLDLVTDKSELQNMRYLVLEAIATILKYPEDYREEAELALPILGQLAEDKDEWNWICSLSERMIYNINLDD